jgi:hypothetical protein
VDNLVAQPSFQEGARLIITVYAAQHHGIEIARNDDLNEVIEAARRHLRDLPGRRPEGSRILTLVGNHTIRIRRVRPDGAPLATEVQVTAGFRRRDP